LFHDEVEIATATDVLLENGRWRFATAGGDAIWLDDRGRVWRYDESLDDDLCDGTRLDRWLAGVIDALAIVYDEDGEFTEDAFDDDGDLLPAIEQRQLRAQLKRDHDAPGPRWRLASVLLADDEVDGARAELEVVVTAAPSFAWAWLDLARISERLGAVPDAVDEARTAAEAAAGHPQAGYFWSQVARLARRADNEPARADAATRAAQLAPELRAAQLAGARESLEAGDEVSARGLLELLRAVWPRDLEVLDLARKLES
jgi:hypothetical protein